VEEAGVDESDRIAGVAFGSGGRSLGAGDPPEGAGAVGGTLLNGLDQRLVIGRGGEAGDGWGAEWRGVGERGAGERGVGWRVVGGPKGDGVAKELPAGGRDGGLVSWGDGKALDGFAVGVVFVVGEGAVERVGDGVEPEVLNAGGVASGFDELGFDVANGARELVFVGDLVVAGGGFGWRSGR